MFGQLIYTVNLEEISKRVTTTKLTFRSLMLLFQESMRHSLAQQNIEEIKTWKTISATIKQATISVRHQSMVISLMKTAQIVLPMNGTLQAGETNSKLITKSHNKN